LSTVEFGFGITQFVFFTKYGKHFEPQMIATMIQLPVWHILCSPVNWCRAKYTMLLAAWYQISGNKNSDTGECHVYLIARLNIHDR
jgi:hypothetical protein